MPRVTVLDASNMPYRIDTFDWEKIRAFIEEWATRVRPPAKWSQWAAHSPDARIRTLGEHL